jgi:hypothetical protein
MSSSLNCKSVGRFKEFLGEFGILVINNNTTLCERLIQIMTSKRRFHIGSTSDPSFNQISRIVGPTLNSRLSVGRQIIFFGNKLGNESLSIINLWIDIFSFAE